MKAGVLRIYKGDLPSIISTPLVPRRWPTRAFCVSFVIGYEEQRHSPMKLCYTWSGRGTRTVAFRLPIFGGYIFARVTADWQS